MTKTTNKKELPEIRVYIEDGDSIIIECVDWKIPQIRDFQFGYGEEVKENEPICFFKEDVLIVAVSKKEKDQILYRYLKPIETEHF